MVNEPWWTSWHGSVKLNINSFGPETPEFTLLTIAPFAEIRQKSAYYVKYLVISWNYLLDLLYRFCRRIGGDDYPDIHLAVAQGMWLWQPVKFGGCSQNMARNDHYSSLRHSTMVWPIVNPLSRDSCISLM